MFKRRVHKYGPNDGMIIVEIITKNTAINDKSTVISNQGLTWAKWVEALKFQIAMLHSLKENSDIDTMKKHKPHIPNPNADNTNKKSEKATKRHSS